LEFLFNDLSPQPATYPANKMPLTPQEYLPTITWRRQLERDLEAQRPAMEI
jgi:hypothetical protein